MPKPSEHKTVPSRLLAYAQEIGWGYVPRAEAEARARSASLFFGDLLHARVCAFNPQYREAEGALGDYVIIHELLHFSVPNHGKLWKSLMRAYLGDYEDLMTRLYEAGNTRSTVRK